MVVATADAAVTNEVPAPVLADVSDVETVATTPDIAAADIECVAKVVHHEAGNQPETGKLAVAQVIVNRAESGRFPGKVCDVANQPGQFFKLAAYNPARNTPMWRAAVDAARAALSGQGNDVAKGAMFFHSAAARPDRFFRSRQRVVQLHDQVFYR
jgi:N-acetylmuramoyl-L-alanine amidase